MAIVHKGASLVPSKTELYWPVDVYFSPDDGVQAAVSAFDGGLSRLAAAGDHRDVDA